MGTQQAQSTGKWDGLVRRSFGITTRGFDAQTRSIEVVASTTTVDSHGDVVEQDWVLDRYKRNPVVLWHHNNFESSGYSFGGACDPEDFLPIGHAQDVRVEGGQLIARIVFGSKEYNEMSERVMLGFKEGHIRAVSVGFYPGTVTKEMTPGGEIYRLGQNELLEISAVPIPSNPDAVAKSIALERERLGRLAAEKAATSGKEADNMAMTPEEKAAFDAALTENKSSRERIAGLEADLRAEKKAGEDLVKDLKEMSGRTKKAEDALVELSLKELVGVKISPAELPEEIETAKAIGVERVLKRLALRPDMKMLAPATADGTRVESSKMAPPLVDDESEDASGEIANVALKAAARA